ncbi:MAG: 50S ribosomal protein L11 [Arcobacteraceae bacterium]|jgi:large subunit ribosomal protein L11|nr:50S ribosomal protein L11 [Campylobacterota bacterium]MDD2698312.1 50S ribosomal protein L11 [Arcobacteraceae bacterium]MDX9743596.1 50S ribosomal protein L11 [Arcobacteraceae bacterium]
MAKKIQGLIKLQIPAGAANPSPPVGPALGQRGVNIMEFCKAFNERTKANAGFKIPVVITVYTDKSFTFITKQPPMSELIMKAAGIKKGSNNALKNKVAKLSKEKVLEIVKQKIADLNTKDVDQAVKIVEGQCRSIGVEVEK